MSGFMNTRDSFVLLEETEAVCLCRVLRAAVESMPLIVSVVGGPIKEMKVQSKNVFLEKANATLKLDCRVPQLIGELRAKCETKATSLRVLQYACNTRLLHFHYWSCDLDSGQVCSNFRLDSRLKKTGECLS